MFTALNHSGSFGKHCFRKKPSASGGIQDLGHNTADEYHIYSFILRYRCHLISNIFSRKKKLSNVLKIVPFPFDAGVCLN